MLLGFSLMAFGTPVRADQPAAGGAAGNETDGPAGYAAAEASPISISSPSDPAVASARTLSHLSAATPESYVGMTRTSARRKIEAITPTSWLARFGDVEAVEIQTVRIQGVRIQTGEIQAVAAR